MELSVGAAGPAGGRRVRDMGADMGAGRSVTDQRLELVAHLVDAVLHAGLDLVEASFRYQILIVGYVADGFLDAALEVLCVVAHD